MRLTIVAAAGGLGRRLVEQALHAGHRVTAVVRGPETLSPHLSTVAAGQIGQASAPPALAAARSGQSAGRRPDASEYSAPVVCVAVTDLAAPGWGLLEVSIEGADAVLSTLGSRASEEIGIAERGTRAIVRAMEATGVRRIVVVSAPPVATLRSESKEPLSEWYGDLALMEDILRASDVDWTVVRPPQLTGDPFVRLSRTAYGAEIRRGPRVSRADVADAMLRAVEQPQTIRQAIGIGN